VQPLAEHLENEDFRSLQHPVVSTVTGQLLTPDEDLRALLIYQVTSPVRFTEAITAAIESVGEDALFIEVGPGRALSGLIADFVETPPVVALDACGPSLRGLLQAVGAAFVLGVPVNHKALFADRFTRPFNLDWQPRFFVNPCEATNQRIDESANPKSDVRKLRPEGKEEKKDGRKGRMEGWKDGGKGRMEGWKERKDGRNPIHNPCSSDSIGQSAIRNPQLNSSGSLSLNAQNSPPPL